MMQGNYGHEVKENLAKTQLVHFWKWEFRPGVESGS